MKTSTAPQTQSNPWVFFALTYGLTWSFWIPAALWGAPEPAPVTTLLHYLGGLMPPLVAIGLTFLRRDRDAWHDYWQRVIGFGRIRAGWYAVILLTAPALTGLGALLDVLLGGTGAQIETRFLANPLAVVPFAFFTLFFGPLPEEIAWRGYALDRLQARWSALASSLVLGLAWTLWHVPLFFIEGSYQHGLIGSLSFWLFWLGLVPQSILMTWIYNHNRRSTLSAVLFHYAVNLTGELFALTERAELCYALLWIVAALVVIAVWGSSRLKRTRPGGD